MANQRRVVQTGEAPAPSGAYCQAIRIGAFVACAGQVGVDPQTGRLAEGLERQTRQAIANLTEVLKAAGCSWSDVVKTTCFVSDIGDFATFNAAYADAVPAPHPARSTVGVNLAAGLLVEIEALAVVTQAVEAESDENDPSRNASTLA